MSDACVPAAELARLVDGELTENRAREAREHLTRCTMCSTELARWQALAAHLAAPVAPPAGARDRVLARLAHARRGDAPMPWRARHRTAAVVTAGAMAAAAAAAVAIWVRGPDDRDAFTARGGGAGHSIARDVDVSLYAASDALVRLRSGDAVSATTPIAIAYRNLGDAAFAMVFARDAGGEIHWIMPAYLDAHRDPVSFAVESSPGLRVLRQATVLDAPAAGHLVVVVAVSAAPHRVSEIEAMPERGDPAALQRRWPDADVRVIDLDVYPGASGGSGSSGGAP